MRLQQSKCFKLSAITAGPVEGNTRKAIILLMSSTKYEKFLAQNEASVWCSDDINPYEVREITFISDVT